MGTEPIRVLVVENILMIYSTIATWLREMDYVVLERVANLPDAERVVKSERVDVMLLDLQLKEPHPRNRAEEVAECIQSAEFGRRMKDEFGVTVVVQSTSDYLEPPIASRLMRAGISYLVKEATDNKEHLARAIEFARSGGAVYDRHVVSHFREIVISEDIAELTPQQRKYLWHWWKGKRPGEIADELEVGPSRVTELARQVRRNLRIRNDIELRDYCELHPDVVK